jgi:hypothetical protein
MPGFLKRATQASGDLFPLDFRPGGEQFIENIEAIEEDG